jgi:hypothetical protein
MGDRAMLALVLKRSFGEVRSQSELETEGKLDSKRSVEDVRFQAGAWDGGGSDYRRFRKPSTNLRTRRIARPHHVQACSLKLAGNGRAVERFAKRIVSVLTESIDDHHSVIIAERNAVADVC